MAALGQNTEGSLCLAVMPSTTRRPSELTPAATIGATYRRPSVASYTTTGETNHDYFYSCAFTPSVRLTGGQESA